MNTIRNTLILGLCSALFTVGGVITGSGPMLLLRKLEGRFWSFLCLALVTGIFIALKLNALAIMFFVLGFQVFLFAEAKAADCDDFIAGSIAVISTIGLISLGFALWTQYHDISLLGFVGTQVDQVIEQFNKISPGLNLDRDKLVMQVPSGIIMILVLALWFSLFVEKWFRKRFYNDKEQKFALVYQENDFSKFKLPEFFIWLAILAGAFGLLDLGIENASMYGLNALNIVMLLYFLQGMAVVTAFVQKYKLSIFWQVFIYFICLFQLFLVVSMVGISDYWVNYRDKFINNKKAKTTT